MTTGNRAALATACVHRTGAVAARVGRVRPGKFVTDQAIGAALGVDCLADVAMLRAQPELYGPVASDPVVSRLARMRLGR